MSIKPGDKVRLIDDEPAYKASHTDRIGEEAVVLAVGVPGYESVKLRDQEGSIFYARPCWLRKPNRPAQKREQKKIQAQARKLTEKRMKELMTKQDEKSLPTFQETVAAFQAIAEVRALTGPRPATELVINLAEKEIFNQIKAGVRWEDAE